MANEYQPLSNAQSTLPQGFVPLSEVAAPGYKDPRENQSDTWAGFKTSFKQLPQMGWGLAAITAAGIESATGEGGLATAAKKFSVGKMQDWQKSIEGDNRDVYELDKAYDKAKSGNFGALVDWAQYAVGYGIGQGLQVLGTAGVGAVVGKLALRGAVEKAAEGWVGKEATQIAATQLGEKATAQEVAALAGTEAIQQAAVKNVAAKAGETAAMAGYSFGMEGGEIGGDLAEKSVKEGRSLTGSELARGFGATLLAGSLEYGENLLSLGGIKGKLPTPFAETSGIGGKIGRAAVGSAMAAPVEAGTEYLQTGIEEYGKGSEQTLNPFGWSPETQRQAINAAGLGAVGGATHATIGGLISGARTPEMGPAPNPDQQLDAALNRMEQARNEVYLGTSDPATTIANIVAAPDLGSAINAAEAATGPSPMELMQGKRAAAIDRVQQELGIVQGQAPELTTDFEAKRAAAADRVAQELGFDQQQSSTAGPVDFEAKRAAAADQVAQEFGLPDRQATNEIGAASSTDTAPIRAALNDRGLMSAMSTEDKQSLLRAASAMTNPELPQGTRQRIAQEAYQIIGQYQAAQQDTSTLPVTSQYGAAVVNGVPQTNIVEPSKQPAKEQAPLEFQSTSIEPSTELGAAPARNYETIEPTGLYRSLDEEGPTGGRRALNETQIPTVPGQPGVADTVNVNAAKQAGATEQQNATLLANDVGSELGRQRVAAGYDAKLAAAPRPTTINGTPAKSLSNERLQAIAADTALPAIVRRGASIEIAHRAAELPQQTKLSEQRTAPEATQQGKPISFNPDEARVVNPATLPAQSRAQPNVLSKQSHRMVSLLASMFGKKVVVFDHADANAPDGFVRRDDSKTIYLNRRSQISHLVVFGHELLHQLRRDNPVAYEALAKVVKVRDGADLNVAGIRGDMEEFTADLFGNRFREEQHWRDVFRQILADHPGGKGKNAAMRLGASVVRVVNKMVTALRGATAFDTDNMVANLEEVKGAVTRALASYAQEKRGEATELIREQVNAARQESQQASVQQERGTGNEGRGAAEAGPGDRVLGAAQGPGPEGEAGQGVSASANRSAIISTQQGAQDGRQPEQTGDRAGRYSSGSLAPLEGAPNVAGASGPDPRLVKVAEQYAREAGIPLRRQSSYVQVDEDRARRIAAAYDAMPHAPNDPRVKEAYDNLARQTLAQYRALERAGYKFYLVDETNDPYGGNPWNAMRDLRANQTMGVFATEAGFGTSNFDPQGNPLLADTGLKWGYGAPDGPKKRVLFNDLFRAVHDAFGHGLEGAGFRAQGEENAWQAHSRLFTGSAVGAITSETRGQNSWLNYGPYGERNRNAKVEDTVFADQKTGLMPEWTWNEGLAGDEIQASEKRKPVSNPGRAAAAADIDNAKKIATSKQWKTNRDFKLAIQDAVRGALGGQYLSQDTDEVRKYLVAQVLKEARAALVTNSNAIGWYDEKVTTALEVVSAVHPELKTDEKSKFAFIWALAVTSNGIKVNKNFELAERAYTAWKNSNPDVSKRQFPTKGIGEGTAAGKINAGLATYNKLNSSWGYDKLRAFATTLQPNRQVLATFGRAVSGEGLDTQVYGAGVLGPKIGNGFFMNLFGEFGQLTMDRWFVRTWGRLTGNLVEIDRAKIRDAKDSFTKLIDLIKTDKEAKKAVEKAIKAPLSKGDSVSTAKQIIKATNKEEVRKQLFQIMPATPELAEAATAIRGKLTDFVSVADELRKSAKSYYKALDGQIESPQGSKQRDMMRAVAKDVLVELQKSNPDLTMADFQALLWYPEKTLYDTAGASEDSADGYSDDEAPDYANAAINLAKQKGISDANIRAAIERARSDIEARKLSRSGGRGSDVVSGNAGQGTGTAAEGQVTPSEKRDYRGRKVRVPVRVEETGETATLTMDAGEALDDIDQREQALQRLLECVSK